MCCCKVGQLAKCCLKVFYATAQTVQVHASERVDCVSSEQPATHRLRSVTCFKSQCDRMQLTVNRIACFWILQRLCCNAIFGSKSHRTKSQVTIQSKLRVSNAARYSHSPVPVRIVQRDRVRCVAWSQQHAQRMLCSLVRIIQIDHVTLFEPSGDCVWLDSGAMGHAARIDFHIVGESLHCTPHLNCLTVSTRLEIVVATDMVEVDMRVEHMVRETRGIDALTHKGGQVTCTTTCHLAIRSNSAESGAGWHAPVSITTHLSTPRMTYAKGYCPKGASFSTTFHTFSSIFSELNLPSPLAACRPGAAWPPLAPPAGAPPS